MGVMREGPGADGRSVVIVGGGKMGSAILEGWLTSDAAPADGIRADRVVVVEPDERRRALFSEGGWSRVPGRGVSCAADVADVADAPDLVVLAVKPQVMFDVLKNLSDVPSFRGGIVGPLFVSIAAGLATSALEAALPEGAPLVRVMPNMPLAIGAGASAVCAGSRASDAQVEYVAGLFGCLGRSVVVDEADMDAVCAVSGSGPAYVAAMIEALRDAGAGCGLDAGLAETLALQTVLGTARLIDEGDQSVAEVRRSICSPGGTTVAALDAMDAAGFGAVFEAGVAAAVKRSKELSRCSS